MKSDANPFASPAPPVRGSRKGAILGWTVAVAMTVAAGLFAWLWYSARIEQREASARLAETSANLANAIDENQKNQEQIAALQTRVADLEAEKKKTAQQAKDLENEMRAGLESRDVTISNLKGKLTVNIMDRVLFDSGEAVLKPDGEAVLQKVADMLTKHPEIKIQVIGHTDNVPIRAGARTKFASNWELSTARALAAVHFLGEQAGVDPRRLGAVGYGEFRPVADNSTAEGRAKNRRIAIAILPDELAGSDAVPPPSAAASTAAAPIAESAPAK